MSNQHTQNTHLAAGAFSLQLSLQSSLACLSHRPRCALSAQLVLQLRLPPRRLSTLCLMRCHLSLHVLCKLRHQAERHTVNSSTLVAAVVGACTTTLACCGAPGSSSGGVVAPAAAAGAAAVGDLKGRGVSRQVPLHCKGSCAADAATRPRHTGATTSSTTARACGGGPTTNSPTNTTSSSGRGMQRRGWCWHLRPATVNTMHHAAAAAAAVATHAAAKLLLHC